MLALGHARDLRHATGKPLLIRSVFDGLSTACFITALVHMKLADLAAMLQVAPLILTALSVLFYREIVGWRRWTAILRRLCRRACSWSSRRPSAFDVWALVALAAAMSSALREMLTRRIDRSIPTIIIAFMGSFGILIAGALFAAAGRMAGRFAPAILPCWPAHPSSSASPPTWSRWRFAASTSRWWRRSATAIC